MRKRQAALSHLPNILRLENAHIVILPRSQDYYLEKPGPNTKHRDSPFTALSIHITTSVFLKKI